MCKGGIYSLAHNKQTPNGSNSSHPWRLPGSKTSCYCGKCTKCPLVCSFLLILLWKDLGEAWPPSPQISPSVFVFHAVTVTLHSGWQYLTAATEDKERRCFGLPSRMQDVSLGFSRLNGCNRIADPYRQVLHQEDTQVQTPIMTPLQATISQKSYVYIPGEGWWCLHDKSFLSSWIL